MENEETKKRKKYVTEKSVHLEKMLDAAKNYKFGYNPKPINLKKDIHEISEITKGTCIFPNRFLDNDNSCVKCDVYEHCSCTLKNLGKRKRNE